MEGSCYDITFPIPRDPAQWSVAHHWFDKQYRQILGFDMAHYQDWAVSGEAWLFTEQDTVEHLHGVTLRFGNHSGVVMGTLCLVAPWVHLKSEYDDWDKNPFEQPMACAFSHTIHGNVGEMTCVFRVYPFQLERLRRLLGLDLVPGLEALIGSHIRQCAAFFSK